MPNICRPHARPDLKQIVDRTMALFAVYTGATLSFFVKDFLFSDANLNTYGELSDWLHYWGFWVSLAVVSLLLRYILGSASHLNHVYIAKPAQRIDGNRIVTDTENQVLRSANICWLFVDILFLIAFGILAVLITRATGSVAVVMMHCVYFIVAGMLWSLLAAVYRANEDERLIAIIWLFVDFGQIVLTLIILALPIGELWQAVILGVSYLLFLWFDLYSLVRWMAG
jgi:hypothetical protein